MKVSQFLTYLAIATQTINAASLPDTNALSILSERADILAPDHALKKRKGGGGRGGGGTSGGSTSSGTGSGGGRSSSGGGRTSQTSSSGGSTRAGSGPARSYGGGYYGGGAAVPYGAGSRTPKGLIAGTLIAPLAILAIMPGLWLYNVYPYYYNNPYRFTNYTDTNNGNNPNGTNTTLPVVCMCQEFSVCGCDENEDQQYMNDLIGNGSYAALNKTLVTVSDIKGTQTLVLNGTLPNGTTAPGGEDSAAMSLSAAKYSGYWIMGLIVLYTVLV